MKKFITKFKNYIKFGASIATSREFAFIYCILGTISQISHTYFLINNISSLDGNFKVLQALMISVFISSSLLYFTAISDNAETKESKKIHVAVTLFTIIEILINIYYYSRHLLIDNINNITINHSFDFVFAVIISCLIPITIKLYSSHIRAKEWLDDIFNDEIKTSESASISDEDLNNFKSAIQQIEMDIKDMQNNSLTDESIINIKTNLIDELRAESKKIMSEYSDEFNVLADRFLNQFKNKIRSEINKSESN